MDMQDHAAARAQSIDELTHHEGRQDAQRVVDSLEAGLTLLADACFARFCLDVQRAFGQDSMMLRSPSKSELTGKNEIDLYIIAESAQTAAEHALVHSGAAWFSDWLARLRMGETAGLPAAKRRLAGYAELPVDARRLAFSRVLDRALPDSRRAPLVLGRLLPLAAGIVPATAFGNLDLARSLRKQQVAVLPAIGDCHHCRGRLFDNGEACQQCGNPLWKHNWLTS